MSDPEAGPHVPADAAPPKQFGGLLLPLVVLVATPLAEIGALLGSWDTFSRLSDFDSLRSGVITGEAVARFVLLVVAPIPLLILLFERRQLFLARFSMWIAALPALGIVALAGSYLAFGGSYVPGDTSFYDRDPWLELAVTAVVFAALAIYLRNSPRLKKTFVN
jgi:hypothetical protein